MKALIDADVILYQTCYSAEYPKDEPIKSFDYVQEVFDMTVKNICASVGATSHTLFLTGKGNFREEIAKEKEYKGTRKQEKPFHYNNLKAYILSLPEAELVEGMEADDAMAIEQTKDIKEAKLGQEADHNINAVHDYATTVICTRDKDLRMVEGWHYGWECGRQPEFHKQWIDKHGYLEYGKGKLIGGGDMFFYAQCLMGDTVDNIPGLPNYGPKKAYDLLKECVSEEELFKVVREEYEDCRPEDAEEYLIEQGRLLWMVRELDDEGQPVMWEFPIDGQTA